MMQKNGNRVRYVTTAAVIAAMYAGICIALLKLSFGFRLAELLTVLPVFTPAAVPGLAVGCLVTNLIGVGTGMNDFGAWDILWGTMATLIAALMTRQLRNVCFRKGWPPVLAMLPPVLVNAAILPLEITLVTLGHFEWSMFWVIAGEIALGQTITCVGGGLVLWTALKPAPLRRQLFGRPEAGGAPR